jgi:hypothetical protein
MAKKNKSNSIWEDEQVSVPNEELVKQSKVKKASRFKWLRRGVWLSLILTPILAIVALMWYMDSQNPEPPVEPPTSLEINDSIGKDAATTTVRDWLSSEPQPIPGAQLLSWNGFTTQDKPAVADAETSETAAGVFVPDWNKETHYFSVRAGNGTLFRVSVEVDADRTLGARVTSLPSLVPLLPEVTSGWEDTPEPWFGYQSTQVTDNITASVNDWLAAYTGGNPATLRNVVGDGDDTHFYMPLSGIQRATAVVERVAYLPSDDPDAPVIENPDTVIARVQVKLLWNGQVQENLDDFAEMSFDLLIEDANTAAPSIVAWGGPGSGPSLKPYQNAVTGITLDSVPDPTTTDNQAGVTPPADTTGE